MLGSCRFSLVVIIMNGKKRVCHGCTKTINLEDPYEKHMIVYLKGHCFCCLACASQWSLRIDRLKEKERKRAKK